MLPILFLAPGLLGLRAGLWTARASDTLSRLQKVVYSVGFSTVSAMTIYSLWSIYRWEPLSPDDRVPFFSLVSSLPVHFLLTVLVGVVAGSFFHNYVNSADGLGEFDGWGFVFERYGSGEVVVRTDSGREVKGNVQNTKPSDTTEGVILSNPVVVNRKQGEETNVIHTEVDDETGDSDIRHWVGSDTDAEFLKEIDLGEGGSRYAYFARDDVEAVFFTDEFSESLIKPTGGEDDRAQEFCSDVYRSLNGVEPTSRLSPLREILASRLTHLVVTTVALASTFLLTDFAAVGVRKTVAAFGIAVAVASSLTFATRRDCDWSSERRVIFPGGVAVVGCAVLFLFSGRWLGWLPLIGGCLIGSLLGSLYRYFNEQHGLYPAVYVGATAACATVFTHTLVFGVWPQFTEQLSLIGVLLGSVALLQNRLRVGTNRAFNGWSRVARDGLLWSMWTGLAVCVSFPTGSVLTPPVSTATVLRPSLVSVLSVLMYVPAAVLSVYSVYRLSGMRS